MLPEPTPHPEEKKRPDAYDGDEVLRRLGATEGPKCDPVAALDTLVRQARPTKAAAFFWLQRLFKTIAEEEEGKRDEAGRKKTCERVLAEYLYETGKKINERYFYFLAIFISAYKNCMNEYGWEALGKSRDVAADERKKEFVASNDGETIPELSNDFLMYHLPKEHPTFDKNLSIELTRHLCEWARKNRYTRACVSLI